MSVCSSDLRREQKLQRRARRRARSSGRVAAQLARDRMLREAWAPVREARAEVDAADSMKARAGALSRWRARLAEFEERASEIWTAWRAGSFAA